MATVRVALAGSGAAEVMAQKAAAGYGDFAVEGQWVGALAAWRQHDCAAAGTLFEGVAARASDVDLRAAALYWAARADMQCARPDRVENRLKNAAQYRETFYGLLARQALGIRWIISAARERVCEKLRLCTSAKASSRIDPSISAMSTAQ
jgi:hypothetical protein